MKLHEFSNGNKTAQIFSRESGYRVVLYDCYTEYTNEVYFDSEEDAENYAEEWVLE